MKTENYEKRFYDATQFCQQTNEKLNFTQLKMLRFLISSISNVKKRPDERVVLYEEDIEDGAKIANCSIQKFINQIYAMSAEYIEMTINVRKSRFKLIEGISIDEKRGVYTFFFDSRVFPYILNYKEIYMDYDISILSRFHCRYSIMLYEYLTMRNKTNQNKLNNFMTDIEELRSYMGLSSNKYNSLNVFEKIVLFKAEEEINHVDTELEVTHKKIKVDDKFTSLEFSTSYDKNENKEEKSMNEENKYTTFTVGDVISLREGDLEGHYIVTVPYEDGYVLTSTNGNKIRVASAEYVNTRAKLLSASPWKSSVEDQAEKLGNTLAKAGISTEELSRPSKEDDTVDENDYDEKLVYEHRELTTLLNSLYKVKNKKYGDSFGQSVREFGYISALTRMSDKYNRLKQLIMSNQTGSDTDESLEDTLVDLANYCLMTVMELNHAKENCTHGNNS